jgi:membrane associated rhomboid family serine protease
LQRTPQGLHGDWWRTLTSLFVQDGGVAGTVSNLAFLLVMGVLTEQVLAAWQWLVCYFGPGWSASWPAMPGSHAAPGTRWPSAGWPVR